MSDTPKTGPELVEEAGKEPTLDEYLRRDPATLTPKDLSKIVDMERRRRAMFIEADAAKKEKKGEEDENEA